MKKIDLMSASSFVVGLVALSFELILAEVWAAFVGEMALKLICMLGVYLLAVHAGFSWASIQTKNIAPSSFVQNNLLVTVTGILSVILLLMAGARGVIPPIMGTMAIMAMFGVGFFSARAERTRSALQLSPGAAFNSEATVLYQLGCCSGAVLFCFYIYPTTGVLLGAMVIALINIGLGLLLVVQDLVSSRLRKITLFYFGCQIMLLILCIYVLLNTQKFIYSTFLS